MHNNIEIPEWITGFIKQPVGMLFTSKIETTSDHSITLSNLKDVMKEPYSLAKLEAPCLAPQLSGVKTKEGVFVYGVMASLWIDIDEGDLELFKVVALLVALGITSAYIYSSASSMRLKNGKLQGKRWRIILPITRPISCTDWVSLQEAFIELLNGDSSAGRIQQILFLPNNPEITDPSETKHYEYHILEGEPLNIDQLPTTIYEAYTRAAQEQEVLRHHQPKATRKLITGQISPIEAYNTQIAVEQELIDRGDEQQGGKWKRWGSNSPPGIKVRDGKMFSQHSNKDRLADGYWHDPFDVMMDRLDLDYKGALKYAAENTKVDPTDENSQSVASYNLSVWKASHSTDDGIVYSLNANGDKHYMGESEEENKLINAYVLEDFSGYFYIRKGKEYWICFWKRNYTDGKVWWSLDKQTESALKKGHTTDKVTLFVGFDDNGNPKYNTVSKASIWINSTKRLTYRGGTAFNYQDACRFDEFNLWHGMTREPVLGSWFMIQWHFLNVICAGNKEHYEYLLDWLADMYQNPFSKPGVAVVLRSEAKGTGKGTFVDVVSASIQDYFLPLSSVEQLIGKFNGHQEGKLLLFADEAVWGGDKKAAGKLMTLITERTLGIEDKFETTREQPNHIHLIMASNNDWVVPAGKFERRYFVLDVSARIAEMSSAHRDEYFTALRTEAFNDGGVEAMLQELLERDLSDKNLRKPPSTNALIQQVHQGLGSVESYLASCVSEGVVLYADPVFVSAGQTASTNDWQDVEFDIRRESLHEAYLEYCQKHGERHPKNNIQFFKRLYEISPNSKDVKEKRDAKRKRLVQLPSRSVMSQLLAQVHGF